MTDMVLNALRRNLVIAEKSGDEAWAARVRARLADLDLAPRAEPEADGPADDTSNDAPAEPAPHARRRRRQREDD